MSPSSPSAAIVKCWKKKLPLVHAKIDEKEKWFFDFPPEIRNMIYTAILSPNSSKPQSARLKFGRWPGGARRSAVFIPNLLTASQTVRREALPIYYKTHKIDFFTHTLHLKNAFRRLEEIIRYHTRNNLGDCLNELHVEITIAQLFRNDLRDTMEISRLCCKHNINVQLHHLGRYRAIADQLAPIIAARIVSHHAWTKRWPSLKCRAGACWVRDNIQYHEHTEPEMAEKRSLSFIRAYVPWNKQFGTLEIDFIYWLRHDLGPLQAALQRIDSVIKYEGRLLLVKDTLSLGPLEGKHVEICDYATCAKPSCWHHDLTKHQKWMTDFLASTPNSSSILKA
jgi:hypothetical protein